MTLARSVALALALFAIASAAPTAPDPRLVLWAWDRPEDLSFLPPGADVSALVGFVELWGSHVWARGRRSALRLPPGRRAIALVHVQIAPGEPLSWTPDLRARTAAAVLLYARQPGFRAVQIDFEVAASRRQVLLDLLHDVRAGLPPSTPLSMTALASWCMGETWLARAPVDEIVPMMFRMGAGGAAAWARLERGGDFSDERCRSALGLSVDTPSPRAPPRRRLYLFDPHPWTAAAYRAMLARLGRQGA